MIRTGTIYWFTCDRCGVESDAMTSMVDATETAQALGWVIKNGLHVCPKHEGEK